MAATLNDDDLRQAIVDAYGQERFLVPLNEVQRARRWRPMWISAAAIATAAAVAVGVFLVDPSSRSASPPVSPGATSYVPPLEFHPELLPHFTREQYEADCRTAGLATLREGPEIPSSLKGQLPPLRAASTETMLGGAFVFASDRLMVQCVRYGTNFFDVAVRNIADGSAPWRRAETLPYETHTNTDVGATMIVGWAPAGTTQVVVRIGGVTAEARIVEFSASDPAEKAVLFLLALPGTDAENSVIVATLPDRIISRLDQQPAMTVPR
jgi:hypothetical protein